MAERAVGEVVEAVERLNGRAPGSLHEPEAAGGVWKEAHRTTPLEDLRIADLSTLFTVERTSSITKAARELGVTPSQVSKAIRRLERHLGARLLVRGAHRVELTAAARGMLPHLASAVRELRHAASGKRRDRALEINLAGPSYLVADAAPTIASQLPQARLRVCELHPGEVRALIAEPIFDVVLLPGSVTASPQSWVDSQVGSLRFALFARPSYAKSFGSAPLSEDRVRGLPFVTPMTPTDARFTTINDECPIPLAERVVAHEARTIAAALELSAATDTVVFGPVLAARRHLEQHSLVEVPVAGWRVRETVHVLCSSDRVLSRVRDVLIRVDHGDAQRTPRCEACGADVIGAASGSLPQRLREGGKDARKRRAWSPHEADGPARHRLGERSNLELPAPVLDGHGDRRKQCDARAARDHLCERREARGPEGSLRGLHPVAEGQRLIPEAVPLFEQEHVLPLEVRDVQPPLARERMPLGQRGHEWIGSDVRASALAHVGLEREQPSVQCPFRQLAHDVRGLLLPEEERELRVLCADSGHHVRQQVRRDGREDANAQRAREWIPQSCCHDEQILGFEQHAAGACHDVGPRARHEHAAPIALEDAHAEHGLELLNLRAQRRLRDVAPRRGFVEAQRVGHGHDVLELSQ